MYERLTRLAAYIGARPRLAAPVFGLLGALGFPPIHAWPIGLLGVAGLVWLVWRSATLKRAFLLGWLFGVTHLTLANSWIATAFTYQAEMPPALGWAAVPLLSCYLAVYPALATLIAKWLAQRLGGISSEVGIGRFGVVLAACWIVTEWLRSWVFTGYPWPPLGLMLLGGYETPGVAAVLPVTGTYALSGIVIAIATVFAADVRARRIVNAALLAVIVTLTMLGIPRLHEPREGTLPYTLVQPNIPQEQRDDPRFFEEHFEKLARLTLPRDDEPRLVLWPEAAVSDYLRPGYPQRYYDQMTAGGDPEFARWRIGRVIGADKLLLTGAVDLEIRDGRAAGARNSVTAIDGSGVLVGDGYAKAHLVPYGEYLALRWLLEPLGATRLVAGTIDFWPGPGPRTLDLGVYGQAGVQICYEIVFSGQVVDRANRPEYIFNPSNDGWFGWFGPPQHLAQARLRAIEEGLPVLRSTTTGISAVIDANGVVRQYIGMQQAARIDGRVPPPHAPTLFSRWGNALPLAWAALLLLCAAIAPSLVARAGGRR